MKIFWTLLLILAPLIVYSSENKDIFLRNGSVLENLTLEGDSRVIIEGDADVVIENCVINTDNKVAVNALPGKGMITLRNSRITSRTGKGLYVQPGRTVDILDCDISNCKEEGIDLRSEIKGRILNNVLKNNGESGIELIVGNSDLEIKNNAFENNAASGLALQFYPFDKNEGRINLVDNRFENNQKYAIDCAIPEGKQPPVYYWNESISLTDNKFSRNAQGIIEKDCNYTGPVDEEGKEILQKVINEFEGANAQLESNKSASESSGFWQTIKKVWNFLKLEIFH